MDKQQTGGPGDDPIERIPLGVDEFAICHVARSHPQFPQIFADRLRLEDFIGEHITARREQKCPPQRI